MRSVIYNRVTREDEQLFEEIKENLEGVKTHGRYFSAVCPFHSDTSPSLMVYLDGFHCRASSCNESGSLKKLYNKIQGYTPTQQTNVTYFKSPPWYKWLEKHGSFDSIVYTAIENATSFPILLAYLKQRGLGDFIKPGRFGWLDGWLIFPVYGRDRKTLVDIIARTQPSKTNVVNKYFLRPREYADESVHIYTPDWNKIWSESEVYAPFGVLDVWSVHACGYASLYWLTGLSFNVSLISDIRKPIYLIPDKGELEAARNIKYQLGWRGRILDLQYPDDCKDCNDVLRLHSVNTLRTLIEEAKHESNR